MHRSRAVRLALLPLTVAFLSACGVQNLYIDDDPVGFRDPFYVIERTLPLYDLPSDSALPVPDLRYASFTVVYTGETRERVTLVADLEQAVEGKWNTWAPGPPFALAEGGRTIGDGDQRTVRGFGVLEQDPKEQYGRPDPRRLELDLSEANGGTRQFVRLLFPREGGLLNGRRYRISLSLAEDGTSTPTGPAERVYYDFYVAQSNTLVSLGLGAAALVGFTILGTMAE